MLLFIKEKKGLPFTREEVKKKGPLRQGKKYLAQRAEMKRRAPPSAKEERISSYLSTKEERIISSYFSAKGERKRREFLQQNPCRMFI
ncbi:hypothetical protein [Macellibacteroides fermentans]|uniref:hypothetical protein n=1 Tax=Macellibacteroides fermentans TaxID=879969 RepID=UPI00406CADD7